MCTQIVNLLSKNLKCIFNNGICEKHGLLLAQPKSHDQALKRLEYQLSATQSHTTNNHLWAWIPSRVKPEDSFHVLIIRFFSSKLAWVFFYLVKKPSKIVPNLAKADHKHITPASIRAHFPIPSCHNLWRINPHSHNTR